MTVQNRERHWDQTRRLMFIALGVWVFFSFIIHMFVTQLNSVVIVGFPLGFYMAAQGSLIVFVALLFWFARAQNKVDAEHGVHEEQ